MPTTVKIRRSGTASATPSALEHGEIAINYADGKMFWKDAASAIQSFSFASIDGGEVLAPPNAPTSLAASPSSGALALTWTAPAYAGSTSITGYTVEYTPSGGSASTVATGSTGTSYTLTGLTNGTSYTVRVRAINSVGSGAYSGSTTATPVSAAYISFSAFYPAAGFSSSEYSTTGSGTPDSPLVAVVGGNHDHDNRLWLLITQSGTLSWSLQMSSEQNYDYGLLYRTTGSPAQHLLYDTIPATVTTLAVRSGTQTGSGTLAVTSGQYVVVQYMKDESGDVGTDNITVTLSIT
jgi:hypothetical protein